MFRQTNRLPCTVKNHTKMSSLNIFLRQLELCESLTFKMFAFSESLSFHSGNKRIIQSLDTTARLVSVAEKQSSNYMDIHTSLLLWAWVPSVVHELSLTRSRSQLPFFPLRTSPQLFLPTWRHPVWKHFTENCMTHITSPLCCLNIILKVDKFLPAWNINIDDKFQNLGLY